MLHSLISVFEGSRTDGRIAQAFEIWKIKTYYTACTLKLRPSMDWFRSTVIDSIPQKSDFYFSNEKWIQNNWMVLVLGYPSNRFEWFYFLNQLLFTTNRSANLIQAAKFSKYVISRSILKVKRNFFMAENIASKVRLWPGLWIITRKLIDNGNSFV